MAAILMVDMLFYLERGRVDSVLAMSNQNDEPTCEFVCLHVGVNSIVHIRSHGLFPDRLDDDVRGEDDIIYT